MGITAHFDRDLGAPLVNFRWSWGAVRSDGTVFLRVWRDHFSGGIFDDGFVRVALDEWYVDRPNAPGYRERRRHLAMIDGQVKAYAVFCSARENDDGTRNILDFNSESVAEIVALDRRGGETWAVLGDTVPVAEVSPRRVRSTRR